MSVSEKVEKPLDADERRSAPPVICYEVDHLPGFDAKFYDDVRAQSKKIDETIVPPRDGRVVKVEKGSLFRIACNEGPQVCDLNLWNMHDLSERFYSGKTRQLHATHLTRGDRLWSSFPGMRPLATITFDTLGWYGWDQDGAGVHDVIGTRCDPYTNYILRNEQYHYCCHSNLTRALSKAYDLSLQVAEQYVHDVMNVFMCTGFTKDTHQYFMKASPVRRGDYLEFFAEIDLAVGVSTCPGGDCSSSHSDDATPCYPLSIEIWKPESSTLEGWSGFTVNGYNGEHGV